MIVDLPRRLRARLDPEQRYGVRVTLFGLALVLVAIPFAALTFAVLGDGPLTRVDGRIADDLNHVVNRAQWSVDVLQGVSWLGRPPLLALLVVVASVWLWRRGQHRIATFLVVTSLGGGIVDTLVKAAVDRPRPVVDHPVATALGKSFPSGHAMSATVTYGALLVALTPLLAVRWKRPARVLTVLIVLAVGCSRLLLGVHFVSDVVGGFVLGGAWLAGAVASFRAWEHDEHREELHDAHREKLHLPSRAHGAASRPG